MYITTSSEDYRNESAFCPYDDTLISRPVLDADAADLVFNEGEEDTTHHRECRKQQQSSEIDMGACRTMSG
jgi:hypothetical protein